MRVEIQNVYNKYNHMDKLMCECANSEEFTLIILSDLWRAIKAEVENPKIED